MRHRPGRQRKVVGQKHQRRAPVPVVKAHPPKFVGIRLGGIEAGQRNSLVAAQPGGGGYRMRMQSAIVEPLLGANDKESLCLLDGVEAREVQIAPVHDVNGVGLEGQLVEPVDLVCAAFAHADRGGNAAPQVQQRVHFDRALGAAEARPRKQAQTQIDGRGVQRTGRLLQFDAQVVRGVKRAGLPNQTLRQRGVNAPVAGFVGVGQRGAGNVAAQSQMVELSLARTQAGFDIPQAFAIGQLGEGQTEKLIPAGEAADFVVATIAGDATLKLLRMNPVQELRQDEFAGVHGRKIEANRPPAEWPDSNRTAYQIVVCGSIVPDPLQTLEPVASPTGPALKNEMMLPAVLDPWAGHALYEAANLAKNQPGSKVWLVSLGPKAKLQQVMMTVAQKVPFELVALDGSASGFTDATETAAALADAIAAIPGLDKSKLLVFGGWESASRGAGATMQMVGERLGIVDQFQGVDQLTVNADGSLEILERIEGGKHQVSKCAGAPALLGWATGNLPEPKNNPQVGMVNMRTVMPALQKAKPVKLAGEGLSFASVALPKQLRETQIVKDKSPDDIAKEIVEWIKK